MAPVQERMVRTDDSCYLWAASSGTGEPAVVLVHGGPGLQDDLAALAELLHDRHQVIRWDQRGAGRSAHNGPYTVDRFVADMESVRIAYGLESWVVLGHAFGANLALEYTLRCPERVEALIYMSGTGLGRSWRKPYRDKQLARLAPDLRERFTALKDQPHRTREQDREYYMLAWAPDFADRRNSLKIAAAMFDKQEFPNYEAGRELLAEVRNWNQRALQKRAAELQVPVLIVHGADDPRPADALNSLDKALPDSRVSLLPGVGHYPWLEQPWQLGRAVREFLDGP